MTAHLKVSSLGNPDTDWEGRNIAAVGDKVRVIVEFWDYATLDGGKFKIEHPALPPAGVEFKVPSRKATGSRSGILRKRQTKPTDLSRRELLEFEVRVARVCVDASPFTLTAVKNCVTERNDAVTIRCLATEDDVTQAKVVVPGWVQARTRPLVVTRGGNTGPTARIGNTVQAPVRFYAQLFFKDPEGVERTMPEGTPVKVLLGAVPPGAIEATLAADGKLSLDALSYTEVQTGRVLSLRFGAGSDNRVICEPPGGVASQTRGPEPVETDPTGTRDKRFFTLPRHWTLRQSDWEVTNDDGRWKADEGTFLMLRAGRPASIGTATSPVKLVLDPHWQFLRFEFFDRLFGVSDHASKRKAVPPMVLLGRRTKTATTAEGTYDVESNWWMVVGGETVQCVPWIIQKTAVGVADKRPSRQGLLRFKLPAKTCMKSVSATSQERVIATTEELKHGPDRLKFYDLPTDWQSRNYFAKLSDTVGEFGWYEDICDKATTSAKPLTFNLDDVVLTDKNRRRLGTWSQDDRLSIFINTFKDDQGCSPEGVFDPDSADKKAWYTKLPASGAVEANENYVIRQPLWTRAIVAKGSLFDVFDQRTVVSDPEDPDYDVVGARAAVRWVDTTDRLGATEMWEPNPTRSGYIRPTTDHKPLPGRQFRGAGRPVMSDHGSMVIQPFYGQHYTPRQGKYTADADKSGLIGRFDMALLRSCSLATVSGNPTEVGVNLHVHRTHFDFADTPAAGAPEFARDFARNVLNRWNGVDGGAGRATLVPQDSSKRVQVTVVNFLQVVTDPVEAHYTLTIKGGEGARDWRNSSGMGMTSDGGQADKGTSDGFASAHEHGHQSALPDEYNERWDRASYGQLSFGQHLPGDPFELDGRGPEFQTVGSPMMNGNHTLHNRYFWPSAEWVRRAVAFPFVVKFNGHDAYKVPPHTDPDRSYTFWPLAAINDFALPAVSPLADNRGKVNAFLYAVGADNFGETTLKKAESSTATTASDGILVFTVLLRVNAWNMANSDMKQLVQALAKVGQTGIGRKLSHKWYVTGSIGGTTPQAWTFRRCAVLFSPRFLVSTAPELPTRTEWMGSLMGYDTEAVAVTKSGLLDPYHAVDWSAPNKATLLGNVAAALAAPTLVVRGTWDADSVISGETRPPEFGAIDTAVSTYEGKDAEAWIDRFNALKALINAANSWANDVANALSPFLAAAQGLGSRAETARPTCAAMYFVRELEKQATALSAQRTEHEKQVRETEAEHGVHFIVHCKSGSPAGASWKTALPGSDLPEADAWELALSRSARREQAIADAKGKIATYKSKGEHDLGGRITALKAIEGPLADVTIASPRGDWNTASVSTRSRPSAFNSIDSDLSALESKSATNYADRDKACRKLVKTVNSALNNPLVHSDDKTPARALRDRARQTLEPLGAMAVIRELEKDAKKVREHLELVAKSRELTITSSTLGGFESELLKAFPSMIGVYKGADEITADDLKPLLVPLGLTSADIHAI